MSFVESPTFDNRDIMTVQLIGCIVEGLDSPRQNGRIAKIKFIAILMECFSGFDGLLDALIIMGKPVAESLESVHPVNLFSLFQRLSPCLRKTILYFWIKGVVQWRKTEQHF